MFVITSARCAHDPAAEGARAATGERDRYLALVHRELSSGYRVPKTVFERGVPLRATVVLYIVPDGRVERWFLESSSGDAEFDAALARLVEDARLPPPPEEMRALWERTGVAVKVEFRP